MLLGGKSTIVHNRYVFVHYSVTLAHLQDTDNSLKAYEQAIEINK